MSYFVLKTGMEMFDACRAYGLALVLNTISEVQDLEENATIQDLGMYYLIEGSLIDKITDLSNDETWLSLFDFSRDEWSRPFLTSTRKQMEDKQIRVKELLSKNILGIINKYKELHPTKATKVISKASLSKSEKKKFETLPLSLDAAATKGIKRSVRDSYDEGWQTFVPIEDFALGVLGNVHFVYHKRWREGANWGSIGILPNPQKIVLRNHLEIQKMLKEKYVNAISTGVALSHYAVHLAIELRKKKADQRAYADKYSSLIYNAMTKTGNQWKPISGGLFPLEFLLTLVESSYETSESIFGVWDNLFRNGRVKGREDLALSLSDFIARPSIDTFEEHVRVHLRYLVDEKVKVRTYPRKGIVEVFEHVRS